jgi:hypothetical protein
MEVKISIAQEQDLQKVSEITGRTIDSVINDAIEKELSAFRVNGELKLVKGVFLKHANALEQQMAKNNGIILEVEEIPCYILGEQECVGVEYTTIYTEGMLLKVPSEEVIR